MKKQIRLYNFFFVPWMLWYLPVLLGFLAEPRLRLLVIGFLAANYALDSFVLYLAMKRRGVQNKCQIWKKSSWKIWIIGYLSDFAGTLFMIVLHTLLFHVFKTSPTNVIGDVPMALAGIALAGALIYFLNKRYAFTKCGLDPVEVHKFSLALAVFTAPYLMLIGM